MTGGRRQRRGSKEQQLLLPIPGGKVERIQPLLRYSRPFPPPDAYAEVFLILRNNTEARIEGWLIIEPPPEWTIEPGQRLMISVRAWGTIAAEFYLSIPDLPAPGAHLLSVEIISAGKVVAEAAFDLRQGLLFLVDG